MVKTSRALGKKWFRSVFLVGFSLIFTIMSPAAVFAKLSSSQLYEYAQNNILFYDPGAEPDCGYAVSNDTYMGKQFSLTESEILGITRMAIKENSCNLTAVKTEASQMANRHDKEGGSKTLSEYLTQGTWYHTRIYYNDPSVVPTEAQINAVKEVLLEGKRNIPPQITEHDCIGDIVWVETDGVRHYAENAGNCKGTGLYDKSLYVSGKTKIHTVYHKDGDHEYFIFYRFADGDGTCQNDVDPFGYKENNPPTTSSYSTVTVNNSNYAGAKVWSDAQLQAVEENKAIYKEAADKYGFPWQIMAVLHYREHSLVRSNPSNGQGVYQLYSYTRKEGTKELDPDKAFLPEGAIDEAEFRRQTMIAAEIVHNKAGNMDLSDAENVKKLFFLYNGAAPEYIEKALKMGFTQEQANRGEGSPYVMNRYDARRDPTSASVSPDWVGRYEGDGEYVPGSTEDRFGAFVLYSALGGGGGTYCSGSEQGGIVVQTAMRLAKLSDPDGTGWYVSGDRVPTPEYRQALSTYDAQPTGYADWYENPGASCDQFVATVMISSGADKDFPHLFPPTQRKYMLNHPEKYQQIVNNHDFSLLQPGDILVTTGDGDGQRHIMIYGGKINGIDVQIGASNGVHTGYVYKFTEGSWVLRGFEYLIFRLIQ